MTQCLVHQRAPRLAANGQGASGSGLRHMHVRSHITFERLDKNCKFAEVRGVLTSDATLAQFLRYHMQITLCGGGSGVSRWKTKLNLKLSNLTPRQWTLSSPKMKCASVLLYADRSRARVWVRPPCCSASACRFCLRVLQLFTDSGDSSARGALW